MCMAAHNYFYFEMQHEVVLSNSRLSWSKRLLVCQFEFVLWSMAVVIGLGSLMGWGPGWCPITVKGHRLEIYSQCLKLKPDSKVISKSFSPKDGHSFTFEVEMEAKRH